MGPYPDFWNPGSPCHSKTDLGNSQSHLSVLETLNSFFLVQWGVEITPFSLASLFHLTRPWACVSPLRGPQIT